jgi:PKD domain
MRIALFAIAVLALIVAIRPARAQDMSMDGGSGGGMAPLPGSPDSSNPDEPPPMKPLRIMQPITGSMAVAPPYGLAPLKVGFFVLASDPENIGFLTYSWNFGDGTVSALPPELYIFHTYANPGTYTCILTIKTVDGRSKTFVQGVDVRAAQAG